jgi:hypothetical protein
MINPMFGNGTPRRKAKSRQRRVATIVFPAPALKLLRGAISSLRSCIADVFFLKIVFNDRRLLLAAS